MASSWQFQIRITRLYIRGRRRESKAITRTRRKEQSNLHLLQWRYCSPTMITLTIATGIFPDINFTKHRRVWFRCTLTSPDWLRKVHVWHQQEIQSSGLRLYMVATHSCPRTYKICLQRDQARNPVYIRHPTWNHLNLFSTHSFNFVNARLNSCIAISTYNFLSFF